MLFFMLICCCHHAGPAVHLGWTAAPLNHEAKFFRGYSASSLNGPLSVVSVFSCICSRCIVLIASCSFVVLHTRAGPWSLLPSCTVSPVFSDVSSPSPSNQYACTDSNGVSAGNNSLVCVCFLLLCCLSWCCYLLGSSLYYGVSTEEWSGIEGTTLTVIKVCLLCCFFCVVFLVIRSNLFANVFRSFVALGD